MKPTYIWFDQNIVLSDIYLPSSNREIYIFNINVHKIVSLYFKSGLIDQTYTGIYVENDWFDSTT